MFYAKWKIVLMKKFISLNTSENHFVDIKCHLGIHHFVIVQPEKRFLTNMDNEREQMMWDFKMENGKIGNRKVSKLENR